MSNNRSAFLELIARSEGTQNIGDRGYNCLVGSTTQHPILFNSYKWHPHILNSKFNSTAAGRYQIIYPTFRSLVSKYGYKDFSPISQDGMAMSLIIERHAIDDVDAGRIADAVEKCSPEWASLPGSTAGQHIQRMDWLIAQYVGAGGTLA